MGAFYFLAGIAAVVVYAIFFLAARGVEAAVLKKEEPSKRIEQGMLAYLRTAPSGGSRFMRYMLPALIMFLVTPVPFIFTVPALVLAVLTSIRTRKILALLNPPVAPGLPGGRPGPGRPDQSIESEDRIDA